MGEVIHLPSSTKDRQMMASDGKFPATRVDLAFVHAKVALFAMNRAKRGETGPTSGFVEDATRLLRLTVRGLEGVTISEGRLKFTTKNELGEYEYSVKLHGRWWL